MDGYFDSQIVSDVYAVRNIQVRHHAGPFYFSFFFFLFSCWAPHSVAPPVSCAIPLVRPQITVKTIFVGLAYLATFVYAANSIGVAGYSIQLALGLGPDGKGKKQPLEGAGQVEGEPRGGTAEGVSGAISPKAGTGFGNVGTSAPTCASGGSAGPAKENAKGDSPS